MDPGGSRPSASATRCGRRASDTRPGFSPGNCRAADAESLPAPSGAISMRRSNAGNRGVRARVLRHAHKSIERHDVLQRLEEIVARSRDATRHAPFAVARSGLGMLAHPRSECRKRLERWREAAFPDVDQLRQEHVTLDELAMSVGRTHFERVRVGQQELEAAFRSHRCESRHERVNRGVANQLTLTRRRRRARARGRRHRLGDGTTGFVQATRSTRTGKGRRVATGRPFSQRYTSESSANCGVPARLSSKASVELARCRGRTECGDPSPAAMALACSASLPRCHQDDRQDASNVDVAKIGVLGQSRGDCGRGAGLTKPVGPDPDHRIHHNPRS